MGEEIREYFMCGGGDHILALSAWKWHEEIEPEIFLSMFEHGVRHIHKTELTNEQQIIASNQLNDLLQHIKGTLGHEYDSYDFINEIDISASNIDEEKLRYIAFCIKDIMKYGTPYSDEITLSPDEAKRLSETLNRLGSMKVKEEVETTSAKRLYSYQDTVNGFHIFYQNIKIGEAECESDAKSIVADANAGSQAR